MGKAESSKKEKVAKAEKAEKPEKTEKVEKTKKTRTGSPYNAYMKEEIPRVKKAQPGITHKEAFKLAASNWATAKENPKSA